MPHPQPNNPLQPASPLVKTQDRLVSQEPDPLDLGSAIGVEPPDPLGTGQNPPNLQTPLPERNPAREVEIEQPVGPSAAHDAILQELENRYYYGPELKELEERYNNPQGLPTIFGEPVPEVMLPIAKFADGANFVISEVLGAPPDLVKAAIRAVDPSFLEGQMSTAEAFRKAFQSVGGGRPNVDGVIERMGAESVRAVLLLGALMNFAGTMAAAEGNSIRAILARDLGTFLQRHPSLAVFVDVGAASGAVFGEETAGPLGGMVGSFAGGVAGAGARGATRPLSQSLFSYLRSLGEPFGLAKPGSVRIPPDKIFNPNVHAELIDQYVTEAMKREEIIVDSYISQAINRARPGANTPNAEGAAINMRKALVGARRFARRHEAALWRKVDQSDLVPVKGRLMQTVARMARAADETSVEDFPMNRMEEIANLPEQVTVKKLRAIRRGLQRDAERELAQDVPNEALVRQQNRLAAFILRHIQNNVPKNPEMELAIAASRMFAQKFRQGPVGDILRYGRNRTPLVDPELTLKKLLARPTGIKQVADIAKQYKRKGVITSTESALRQQFYETATEQGPKAGIKFLKDNKQRIRHIAQIADEFRLISSRLTEGVKAQQEFQRGALLQFTKEKEALKGMETLLRSPSPLRQTKEIYPKLDADGKAAYQNAVITTIYRINNGSPRKIKEFIEQPHIRDMLEEIYPYGARKRIGEILDMGAALERGEQKAWRKARQWLTVKVFQVTGAQFGGKLGDTAGGSLQSANIFSTIGRNLGEFLLKDFSPETMIDLAVSGPNADKWFKLLKARVPETPLELRKFQSQARDLLVAVEATRHQLATEAQQASEADIFGP